MCRLKLLDPQDEKDLGEPENCTGNPCDPASGNKFQSEGDYRGAEGTPGFLRSYNSGLSEDVGLGRGWMAFQQKRLVVVNAASIFVRAGDGRGEHFVKNASGHWQGDADTSVVLTQDASGYTLTQRRGSTERYNASGILVAETDANGKTTAYAYDSAGRLAAVTGPHGHALRFSYSTAGRLISMTDPNNFLYGYVYDNQNRLIRVNYPDGSAKLYHYENAAFPYHLTGISYQEVGGTVTRYATYGYNANGKAILTEHAGGMERYNLQYDADTQTTVTDAAGTTEVMNFSVNLGIKNLVSKVNQGDGKDLAQTFDANNNVTCKKDEAGRVTTYIYNSTNQKTAMTEGQTGSCALPVTTSATRTTTYQYLSAELNLPTQIQGPSVRSGSSKTATITYGDTRFPSLPTRIVQSGYTPSGDPVSRTISLTYNSSGQVIAIDGPRSDVGDVTTLAYYECTTGGACGQLQSITNAAGHTTTYDTYDGAGRLLQMTDPNGLRTNYAYDARGRVIAITQTQSDGSIARITHYTYNAAGNITSATFPDGAVLTYTYDAAQKLRQVTDNLGNRIDYNYDLRGNRTEALTFDPDGTLVRAIEMDYDLRNRITTLNGGGSISRQLHDALGNLIQDTDPNQVAAASGISTQHQYDALNRLIQTVNNMNGVTAYRYDVGDRLTQVQAPNNATTQYVYDDLGKLLQETSPDRGTTTYTYDAAGNATSRTDARGITTSYTYDALNRITAIDYPGEAEDVTFTYDAAPSTSSTTCTYGIGRLCHVLDESGATAHAYDAFGNVIEQHKTELDIIYITAYTYDARDRLTSVTYPDGRIVNYARDPLGRITTVTTTRDAATQTVVAGRTYRADGRLLSQTYGNGLIETRTYDLNGQLTYQSIGSADTRVYTYDPNGNLTQKQALPEVGTYTYDPLDRLTATARDNATEGYTYDVNGNRLTRSMNGATSTLTYTPTTNRLARVQNIAVTLDPAGNTTADTRGRTFRYNAVGRLAEVSENGSLRGTYVYNYQGQRTQKTTAHGTTVYHYDVQGNLLQETDSSGAVLHTYHWADGQPLAAEVATAPLQSDPRPLPCERAKGGERGKYKGSAKGRDKPKGDDRDCAKGRATVRNKRPPFPGKAKSQEDTEASASGETLWIYLHADPLDTPRLATSDAGIKVWSWEGEAFGDTMPNEDPDGDGWAVSLALRYAGQYYDSESSLFYNWNRYYDPRIGRYISSDPIGLLGGLNTYAYVFNNPLRWIDPIGWAAFCKHIFENEWRTKARGWKIISYKQQESRRMIDAILDAASSTALPGPGFSIPFLLPVWQDTELQELFKVEYIVCYDDCGKQIYKKPASDTIGTATGTYGELLHGTPIEDYKPVPVAPGFENPNMFTRWGVR